MGVIIFGSIAFDDVVTQHGEVMNALGGSALYCTAAASLFVPVDMVGVVGDDFPIGELSFLENRGVTIDGVKVITGGKTFRWACEYELDMNKRKTTLLECNVFNDFNPVLNNSYRHAPYVFIGNIDPDIQLKVLGQLESSECIAVDTIACYLEEKPDKFREVLKRINVLFINDAEARLFTGEHSIISAARALLDFGPEYVIVKKGEHGSILVSNEKFFVVSAYPVENVIDPPGAGDSFAGGAMGYIAKMQSLNWQILKTAVVYGGIIASFVVEGFSLETVKNVTPDDVEERMVDFRSMTSY